MYQYPVTCTKRPLRSTDLVRTLGACHRVLVHVPLHAVTELHACHREACVPNISRPNISHISRPNISRRWPLCAPAANHVRCLRGTWCLRGRFLQDPSPVSKRGGAGAGGCRLTGLTLMSQTFPKDGMSRGIPHWMNPPVPPDESPHRDWLGQVCQILGKVLTRGDALLRPYSGGVHRLTGVCTGLFLCTPLDPAHGRTQICYFLLIHPLF